MVGGGEEVPERQQGIEVCDVPKVPRYGSKRFSFSRDKSRVEGISGGYTH